MQTETVEIPLEVIDKVTGNLEEIRGEFSKTQSQINGLKTSQDELNAIQNEGVSSTKKQAFSFTELKSGIDLVIGAGKQVYAVLSDLYGSYSKYAGQVRDLSIATGTSAEETSTLLQVLDDYQITAEDVTAATKKMKDNGLVPTIDTLAKLSDQFLAIKDPAERLQFAQDNLGKSYSKYLNVLEKGGNVIRNNANEVNKNLILTDKQIKQSEEARLAIDAMSDAWEGLKVQAGAAIGSIIAGNVEAATKQDYMTLATGRTHDEMMRGAKSSKEYASTLYGISAEYERAASMGEYWAGIVGDSVTPAVEDNTEAIKALSDELTGQIGLINDMQSAEDSYTEKSKDLTQKRAEAEANLAEVKRQGWWESSEQMQNAIAKVEEIKQAEADLAAERDKQTLQFISNILQENLARDGWTTAEFEAFAAQQEAWGLWSADVVEKSKAAWMEAQKITDAINGIPTEKFVNIGVVTTYSSQGQAAGPVAVNGANIRNGYSEGTHGWRTVPQGFANDTYPAMLSSGEKFAVIPKDEQQPDAPSSGGGNGGMGGANLIPILQQFADMIARSNRAAFEKAGR